MPNIGVVLKQEITRLSRKEAKAHTDTTRKAVAQYRRDIAKLKRDVGALMKRAEFLERQERKRSRSTPPKAAAEGKRFSARGLATHRAKLGLSAADYGDLVGVTGQTIFSWEQGKSRPRDQKLAALVALRGLGKRDAAKRLELLRG
jgi:DNA-binding transcriptional regulator YiaG